MEGAVNKVAAVNSMCDRSPPPDIDTGTIYGFELRLGLTPRRGEPKRADTHVYKVYSGRERVVLSSEQKPLTYDTHAINNPLKQ